MQSRAVDFVLHMLPTALQVILCVEGKKGQEEEDRRKSDPQQKRKQCAGEEGSIGAHFQ